MKLFKLYTLLFLLFTGCDIRKNGNTKSPSSDRSAILHIYEYPNKKIKLNGNPISVKELDKRFLDFSGKGGIVYYSCVGVEEEPPSNSDVIVLLKKYRISVKIFTDSTFTTPIY